MDILITLVVGFCILVLIIYAFLNKKQTPNLHGFSKRGNQKNVLIVTAHPDDECMFFAPTILNLSRINGNKVHILCLTTGDFDGLGKIRTKELADSCSVLGISKENVEICDNSNIKDDPASCWERQLVADIIQKTAQKFNCTTIVTFDEFGISGHTNHIGAHNAVKYLASTTDDLTVFYLRSVGIIEKYCSILVSLPLSLMSTDLVMISPPSDVITSQRAMLAHWSQFVWFRILYIIFSSYMILNRLQTGTSSERQLYLSINADDFGYSDIRNQGMVECYKSGAITNVTLMVNGIAAKHAVGLAQKEGIPLGLHLNITEGNSLSHANLGTAFVDKDGKLLGKFDLRTSILEDNITPIMIEKEIEAQIETFRELTGRYPHHVDGHHHIHTFPVVREVFAKILESYGIKSTRLPLDYGFDSHTWNSIDQEDFMSDIRQQSIECKDLFQKHGIRFTDTFLGTTLMGSDMTLEKVQTLLSSIVQSSPAGQPLTCELMVHPGYPEPSDNAGCGSGPDEFSMSHDRKHEMDILMSEEMTRFYEDNHIKLCSFNQVYS